jgi:hypothetical protein
MVPVVLAVVGAADGEKLIDLIVMPDSMSQIDILLSLRIYAACITCPLS